MGNIGGKSYSDDELFEQCLTKFGVALHKSGRQMVGACPECHDGEDRFIVWAEGNYYCRVCDTKGFLFGNGKQQRTPEEIEKAKQYWEEARAEKKRRAEIALAKFDPGKATQFHNNLTTEHIQFWVSQGISEDQIEDYQLGFVPKKPVLYAGEYYHVDSYTIPILHPTEKRYVNIQYRLTNPPGGKGKYRQEPDIPQSALFYHHGQIGGMAIVLEGSKKCLVVGRFLGDGRQVIGLPGISPGDEVLEQLEKFDKLILVPDPDAFKQAYRITQKLRNPKIAIVEIAVKPDDAIVRHKMSQQTFENMLTQAYWVRK